MEEQPTRNALSTSWNKITSVLQRKSKTSTSNRSAIGIEDIDATWEFAQFGDYNTHLDEALKENGITKHWLCTDMRFDDEEMRARENLEAHLKERGHELLGVITSADYAWHIDEKTLLNFREMCVHPDMDIDLKQKRNLHKIPEILAMPEFISIQQLLKGDITHQVEPGTVYALVKQGYCAANENPNEENNTRYDSLKLHARAAKHVLDLMCAGFGSKETLASGSVKREERAGVKGLILRPLLTKKQPDTVSYVFFDDRQSEVLDVIYESANGDAKNTLISAFVSPTKKDKDYSKEYYTKCIHKHFVIAGIDEPATKTSKESHRTRRRALSITANPSESSSDKNTPKSGSRSKTPQSSVSSSASSDDLPALTLPSGRPTLKSRLSSAPK